MTASQQHVRVSVGGHLGSVTVLTGAQQLPALGSTCCALPLGAAARLRSTVARCTAPRSTLACQRMAGGAWQRCLSSASQRPAWKRLPARGHLGACQRPTGQRLEAFGPAGTWQRLIVSTEQRQSCAAYANIRLQALPGIKRWQAAWTAPRCTPTNCRCPQALAVLSLFCSTAAPLFLV